MLTFRVIFVVGRLRQLDLQGWIRCLRMLCLLLNYFWLFSLRTLRSLPIESWEEIFLIVNFIIWSLIFFTLLVAHECCEGRKTLRVWQVEVLIFSKKIQNCVHILLCCVKIFVVRVVKHSILGRLYLQALLNFKVCQNLKQGKKVGLPSFFHFLSASCKLYLQLLENSPSIFWIFLFKIYQIYQRTLPVYMWQEVFHS